LLYSFGSGLRESLSCVSLRARIEGDCEKARLLEAMRGARAVAVARVVRRERRRVGRSIVWFGLRIGWWLNLEVGFKRCELVVED
jgi:hypothetical protein